MIVVYEMLMVLWVQVVIQIITALILLGSMVGTLSM